MVNLIPKLNNVLTATTPGINYEVQPEYWERFEDAFATEANEFVACILDKEVPVKLEIGLMSLKIGWALQHALLSGERISPWLLIEMKITNKRTNRDIYKLWDEF
jgi:myo-inositol 2-dehydrogenase/D-chiro-inositol 1-dehydrogenase